MPRKPCLRCGALTPGTYCPPCKPRNGSTWAYRKARASVLPPGAQCYLCGAPATEADHVIPVARGGTDHPDNLKPVCLPCNRAKGTSLP